jgi:hypothetical protein
MAKKKTGGIATIIIILIIITFSIYVTTGNKPEPVISEELARCIADSGAKAYTQTGCIHCENQKELFGDNWKYINEINLQTNYNEFRAAGITGTPAWIINGKTYEGFQGKENLKTITGCVELE